MSFVTSSYPWAFRGNSAGDASGTNTGVFYFNSNNGGAYGGSGVRASIS